MGTARVRKTARRRKAASTSIDDPVGLEASGTLKPISYFGTDFDVHGLVRRLKEGDIVIPSFDPTSTGQIDLDGFQRKFVWKNAQMNRFVESLLLGFPVPGIFLVQQEDRRLLVLDGQQRLRTLQAFYANELKLEDVSPDFDGATYSNLDPDSRRTLDNTFIHATVVKHDAESSNSIYQLFERLNTGGTNLQPHEIRVALYNGKFVELIRDLNSNNDWRILVGQRNLHLKDHELILRFLALYFNRQNYKRPLKSFLNDFLRNHRDLEGLDPEGIGVIFSETCAMISASIGRQAFRLQKTVNAALVDSIMIGVATRLASRAKKPHPDRLKRAYSNLTRNSSYLEAIARATADEERVKSRLELAINEFGVA